MAGSRSRSTEETKVYLLSSVLSSPITSDSNKWFRKSFLASSKDIADTISLARAEEDYNAPDCRFINIKKGQLIYVYSKLVKDDNSGEFWDGSVYGEQYEDCMGTVGYFPRSLVSEQLVYQEANKTVHTMDIDFFCE